MCLPVGPLNSGPSSIFAPLLILCQSSGHGKSRCMKEFSKSHLSIYISLGDRKKDIYPRTSNISELLLNSLENIDSAHSFFYNLVEKSLDLIFKIKLKNNSELLLVNEFNSYQYLYIDQTDNQSKNENFFNEMTSQNVEKIDAVEMNRRIRLKYNTNSFTEPLFIFFDEANLLLDKSNEIDQNDQNFAPNIKYYAKPLKLY